VPTGNRLPAGAGRRAVALPIALCLFSHCQSNFQSQQSIAQNQLEAAQINEETSMYNMYSWGPYWGPWNPWW
jgi:hypothetical protein